MTSDDSTHGGAASDARRRERLTALFDASRRLPAAEREAFVDASCQGDLRLREELLGLLCTDEVVADAPVPRTGPLALARDALGESDRPLPEHVGGYRIVRVLGVGGMGTVYEAEQAHPRRAVAIKILTRSMATRDGMRRFRREAELLGQLRHANIAHIHEAGSFEGSLYIVMELVRGLPLVEHAQAVGLDVRARLELFLAACDAVQHAHSRGIIHRDLKPANILVDEDGSPKVLDFGIARVVGPGRNAGTLVTTAGEIIGTLAYMSPEQVTGDPALVDVRSDVHALGIILAELLTGRRPLDVGSLALADAIARIRDDEPARLSSMDRSLAGDLETIVAKALEKEPERRYATVAEMAADVRRHLRDEPIVARPASVSYQLAKFARRHRPMVVAALVAVFALVAGTVVSVRQAVRATRASHQSARDAALASERESIALGQAYRASIAAAQAALADGDVVIARQRLTAAPEALRGWEWRLLAARLDEAMATFSAPGPTGVAPCFLPGDRVVVPIGRESKLSRSGVLATFDLASGARADALPGPSSIVDAPAECWVAATYVMPLPAAGGAIDVRDAASGRALARLLVPPGTSSLQQVSPDGGLAEARIAGRMHVASLRDGAPGPEVPGWSVAFSADGHRYAVLREDRITSRFVDVHEMPGWRVVQTVEDPGGGVAATALDASGRVLVTGARDGRIRLWSVATGRLDATSLETHEDRVTALAVRSDGLVASGGEDRMVALWSPDLSRRLAVGAGHEGLVDSAAFSPAGDLLVTRDAGAVRVWDVESLLHRGQPLRASALYVYGLAFSPDGSRLASVAWDGYLRIWNTSTEELLASVRFPSDLLHAVAWSPDGRLVAVTAHAAVAYLVDARTGERLADIDIPGLITNAWFSDDSRLLNASGGRRDEPETRRTWDVATLRMVSNETEPPLRPGLDGKPSDRDLLFEAPGRERRWGAAELRARTADGRWLALATSDRGILAWEVGATKAVHLRSPPEGTLAVALSPDGTRLASGGHDRIIHVHDLTTGEELLELTGHRDYVHALAFSPDGSRLASGSGDGTIRLWDTTPGRDAILARRKARALRSQLEPRVRAALDELGPRETVRRLHDDASLDAASRAAALDVALRLSAERASAAAASISPSDVRDGHAKGLTK